MNKKLVFINTIALALFASSQAADISDLKGSKPNVIVVMTDDQGMGDLSCMGNTILKTPHIDSFYQKSTRFTDFQVSPTCAPTRAALMSGRFPFKVGITHTILQRERMAQGIQTLPEMLKTAGYTTGLFGKWHLGDENEYLPQNRGFDEVLMHGAGGIGQVGLGDFEANRPNTYFDNMLLHNKQIVTTKGFCTDVFFDAAKSWIYQQEQSKKPYFAYISLNAPHGPFYAPDSYKKRFLEEGYDQKTAARYGMIENIDDNFGQLFKQLEEWKALENTIVVFMTDNGMSMPRIKYKGEQVNPFNAGMRGRKNSPDEGGTHVPAFWYWKGVLSEGVDIPALTAHIDFYPTFTELAGAKLPSSIQDLDGRSLLPLLANPEASWADRDLFFHCGRWNAGERDQDKYLKCAIRTKKWRLVDNKNLYDIENDPNQTQELSLEYPDVVKELSKKYDQWWESALPLMVNEGLPKVTHHPFHILYEEQIKQGPIPQWSPIKY